MTELVADDGKYITQAAEVWDARVFCTRRVLTSGETASDWRDATQKEKDDYEVFTPPPAKAVPDSIDTDVRCGGGGIQ